MPPQRQIQPANQPLHPVVAPFTVSSHHPVFQLVLNSVSSPHTRRAYGTALRHFANWHRAGKHGPFRRALILAYRVQLESMLLSASSINQHLAAIRKLAAEAAENGLLDQNIAAGILRVKGVTQRGRRAGNWLTREQAQRLLLAPEPLTLKGKRDRVLLALMMGCGLRRQEACHLEFSDIQMREARWLIVDLVGKHARVRSIPIPSWTKAAIDTWGHAAGIKQGRILRPINKGDSLCGYTMTAEALRKTVHSYCQQLGLTATPHDLRRTFAKLAHRGRAPLEQIQLSLGHASIVTTERYLGVDQDLHDAPCDRLGLKLN